MIHFELSQRLTNSLISNEIIDAEDKELYLYGFKQGFIILLNIFTTLLIGIAFEMIWQSIIFMISYIPLRSFAGGYHAKTQLRCYLFSTMLISAALWGIKQIPWTSFIGLIVSVVAGMIVFFLAPVEDSNKPLNPKEEVVNRKRTRIILIIESIVAFILIDLGLENISACAFIAVITLAGMLILGIFKNYSEKN